MLIDPRAKELEKIMNNVSELELQIRLFQGEKDSKEFFFLNDLVTRYRNALNAIETNNGHEDLEEKCKEILMMINQCKFILDRNSLPLEKLGESDFKNMANEHKTNEKIAIFSKIRKIRNITSDLEKQISVFQSGEMEEYRYLEEMLSSNIFALDSIDTTNLALTQPEGALDMRQKRKEVINWNQKLLDKLDSKLNQKSDSKIDGIEETNEIILNEVKVIENRKPSIFNDVQQSDCNQFETNRAECSSMLNMVL